MGFGFNLGMIFIVLPVTVILVLLLIFTRSKIIGILLGFLWAGIFGLVILSSISQSIFSKKVLDKDDFYGDYVVDRSFFEGPEADWQYNHFRFTITEDDSIFFHVTDGERIIDTYKGIIYSPGYHKSARLGFSMAKPTHHVVSSNPTIYRDVWDFYIVLKSPKYNNMFFIQDSWEPID